MYGAAMDINAARDSGRSLFEFRVCDCVMQTPNLEISSRHRYQTEHPRIRKHGSNTTILRLTLTKQPVIRPGVLAADDNNDDETLRSQHFPTIATRNFMTTQS